MLDLIPYLYFPPSRNLVSRSLDVVESDNTYTITLETPGIDQENLSVRVVQDELHVKGKNQRRSIDRIFLLPKGTLSDAIDATLENGVLTIVVPKLAHRVIDVKVKNK
jgi:HSP20 family protein